MEQLAKRWASLVPPGNIQCKAVTTTAESEDFRERNGLSASEWLLALVKDVGIFLMSHYRHRTGTTDVRINSDIPTTYILPAFNRLYYNVDWSIPAACRCCRHAAGNVVLWFRFTTGLEKPPGPHKYQFLEGTGGTRFILNSNWALFGK